MTAEAGEGVKYEETHPGRETMRKLFAGALLLTAVLVGCVGTGSDDVASTQAGVEDGAVVWHEKALPFGPGHDHTDPTQHEGLTTPNFEVSGHSSLNSSAFGQPAGAYFCGDAKPVDGDRRLAATESRTRVGFAIADVTDPAEPVWLGEFVMESTRIYDLAVVPDGEHVVIVTSGFREDAADAVGPEAPGAGEQRATGLTWRSPCADGPVPVQLGEDTARSDHAIPRPMQVLLIDITDPSQPTVADQEPLLGSGHSVYTNRVDDTDWALVTTTRVPGPVPTPGVRENGVSFYEFYRVADGPTGAQLELASTYKRPFDVQQALPDEPTGAADLGPRGHDGRIKVHPGTGETVAYLAGGDRFSTLDMSDPSQPSRLGSWEVAGPATPAEEGTMHSVYPIDELWNGTHYTVVGPEHAGHPEGAPSGIIWVLDTTDPAQPEPVAAWTLPAEVNWNGTFMFSNHYLSVVDHTLFVSMYHGGVWAVDLSPLADGEAEPEGDVGLELLDSVGVWMPTRQTPAEPADFQRWAPTSEEVLAMPDGSLVSFSNTGVFTATFDASQPMAAPEPWPLEDAVDLEG